ncbi:uncharacterized protein HaLaN_32289, partial [Haematococcus lacustris]
IVSRAHRMGATNTVHVEQFVMRGTGEEQMLELASDTSGIANERQALDAAAQEARRQATHQVGAGSSSTCPLPAASEDASGSRMNTLEGQGVRNLFFLRLRKVNMLELPKYENLDPQEHMAADVHHQAPSGTAAGPSRWQAQPPNDRHNAVAVTPESANGGVTA